MGEKTSTVTFLPSTSNSSMLSQPQLHDLDVNAPVDESQKEKKQILEPDYNFQCKYCDQNFPALHVLKWHQKQCQGSDTKTKFDEAIAMNTLPYAFDLASRASSVAMLRRLAKVAKVSSTSNLETECQVRIAGKPLKIME